MVISLFQQNIDWLNPAANYSKIEKVLKENPETELLVMPEMCTTGFITLPKEGQIEKAEVVETRLLELSKKYNTALCGSFAVKTDNDGNRNRCYFITPEGIVHHYDKHHLFSPGHEDQGYTSGRNRVTVVWKEIKFRLCVCYDLRFPTWLRYTEEQPYDILICVANWPSPRQFAWDTLLRARAIENQAYCIGVNRVGQDQTCEYQGGTVAIHPYGHPVASCNNNTESVCSFTPDMEKLKDFRRKFPSLRDAD